MEQIKTSWEDRRAATLKDVARLVGISEATASVVLNGARSGTRVSATTRRAVVDAAAHLGYRPNSVARALQAGRNHRIGIYSGRSKLDARNLFYAEVLGGMCEAACEQGANIMMHTAGDSPEKLLELTSSAALDGLIVHAGNDDPIMPLLMELRAPAIWVADRISGLPSVGVDDVQGGRLQAEHLAEKGHRHVLYKQTPSSAQSAVDRRDAFLIRAEELGIRSTIRSEIRYDLPFDEGDLQLLTSGRNRATAFVAWHDRAAEVACGALVAAGLRVPEDVAVIGFDGFRSYYAPKFSLTTVRAPWSQVGRVAVELLAALVRGETVPHHTSLPVEFAAGATT